jgi:hypothetical protein
MNILIVGDSFSHTCAFVEPEGKLWVSSLIKRHHVTNLSYGGQSNYKIFTKAMSELSRNPTAYDLVIIQWSSLFRLTLNDNFSIYENLVAVTVEGTLDKELRSFHKLWSRRFIHGLIEIEEWLTMALSLAKLIKQFNKPYIFIKTFDNFVNELHNESWKDCSEEYQKSILDMDKHPDYELDSVHRKLRQLSILLKTQSLDSWVNYNDTCWVDQRVDFADDNKHPGIETNKIFYQQVFNFAKSIGINL